MKLFYNTEEVAQHLGIPISKLTYYIQEFRLNIQQVKRKRKFSHNDVEKLEKIIRLIDYEGYTLDGVKEKLKEKSVKIDTNSLIIEKLKDIKNTLILIKENISV